METIYAMLIHKTNVHFLPTNLPAHFFGMPNGKVMIVYARFYDIKFGETGVEYVIAEHKEFRFNYFEKKLISLSTSSQEVLDYEAVDKPDPVFVIKDVYRNINSFSKVYCVLNEKAKKEFDNL